MKFLQVSWARSMVGWVLHTQSKTASPTMSVPRSWGTTSNSCICWGQRKNCVENGVLLAIYVIETVCYHRCQNSLHLNSMGVYRTWLASYILTFVTVSDGMLFKSLTFSLTCYLIQHRTSETAIQFFPSRSYFRGLVTNFSIPTERNLGFSSFWQSVMLEELLKNALFKDSGCST